MLLSQQPGMQQPKLLCQLMLCGEVAILAGLLQRDEQVFGAVTGFDNQSQVGVATAAFRLQRLPSAADGAAKFVRHAGGGTIGHRTGCRLIQHTNS